MKLKTKNGYEFEIDEEDIAIAKKPGWYGWTQKHRYANGEYGHINQYIIRNTYINGKRTVERLHRSILNAPLGADVDHINGKGLDCRKNNLRLCTRLQNSMNSIKHRHSSSKYKGVTWRKIGKCWEARIKTNGKQKCLGYFNEENQAAIAYNKAAIEYFGEFSKLNEV